MAIRAGKVLRDVLTSAALPAATKTYTVISHGFVINTAKRMLHDKGFNVVNESYTALDGAQVACGAFHINYGDDPELGMLFAFANSYDKSLKFSCAVGAYVKLNETSILSKDGSAWVRMHTGNADQEAEDTIEKLVDNAEAYFKQLQTDKEAMKQITLTTREFGELLGRLFIEERILGLEQLSIIRNEFKKPSYKYADTHSLWTLYNHILVGIAKANPKTWMEQQKLIHFNLMSEYDFTVFDEEDVVDPNQLDLVDEIEEAESVTEVNSDTTEDADAEMQDIKTEEIIKEREAEDDVDADNVEYDEDDADDDAEIKPIVETEPVVEKPKPTISMKEAVEKYGHLITEEQSAALLKGEREENAIATLREAYLRDQEEKAEEEFIQQGAKVMTAGEPTRDLDAEEDADAEKYLKPIGEDFDSKTVLKEIVEKQVEKVINEEYVKSATDGKTQLPKEDDTVSIVDKMKPYSDKKHKELAIAECEAIRGEKLPPAPKSFLSPMPGQKRAALEDKLVEDAIEKAEKEVKAEIETREVDDVLKAASTGEFFMTKQDLDEMNEGVELEVGFLVTIGEDDCEIVSVTDNAYGLMVLTTDDEEMVDDQVLEPKMSSMGMDFEIGDAEQIAPVETMLKKPKVAKIADEEQAKIDAALEAMNSKVELTKEEQDIQDAIGSELEELYGVAPNFTYVLKKGEYIVTLESNEVVVLTKEYIDELKSNIE